MVFASQLVFSTHVFGNECKIFNVKVYYNVIEFKDTIYYSVAIQVFVIVT